MLLLSPKRRRAYRYSSRFKLAWAILRPFCFQYIYFSQQKFYWYTMVVVKLSYDTNDFFGWAHSSKSAATTAYLIYLFPLPVGIPSAQHSIVRAAAYDRGYDILEYHFVPKCKERLE